MHIGSNSTARAENSWGRVTKSSKASLLGVFRPDPPLASMPPFLPRVCWQGRDACCAPPMTSPPLPVGCGLSVLICLPICLLAARDVLCIIFGRPFDVLSDSANCSTWVLSSYDSLCYNPYSYNVLRGDSACDSVICAQSVFRCVMITGVFKLARSPMCMCSPART